MAMVIRVRFKRAAKLYDFDPNGLELHNGMSVVTETARGVELGECMSGVMDVPDERLVLPLKPILRIATEQDLAMQKRNEQAEKEAFDIAIDRIAEHKLEMKLVDVEYAFDRSKIIFYFTANGRVDFRMLVKSLASIFKTRIELRQIAAQIPMAHLKRIETLAIRPPTVVAQVGPIGAHGMFRGVALRDERRAEIIDGAHNRIVDLSLCGASLALLRGDLSFSLDHRLARAFFFGSEQAALAQLLAIALKRSRPAMRIGRIALTLVANALVKRPHDAEIDVHRLIPRRLGVSRVVHKRTERCVLGKREGFFS